MSRSKTLAAALGITMSLGSGTIACQSSGNDLITAPVYGGPPAIMEEDLGPEPKPEESDMGGSAGVDAGATIAQPIEDVPAPAYGGPPSIDPDPLPEPTPDD